MSEREEQGRSARVEELSEAARPEASSEDVRKPYEAPKIVKRRSVIHATSFLIMSPMMTGN